jgi:hypothetical protein
MIRSEPNDLIETVESGNSLFTNLSLSDLVDHLPDAVDGVQDAYPLSSLQEGMLVNRLPSEQTDTYIFSTLIECDSYERLRSWIASVYRVLDTLRRTSHSLSMSRRSGRVIPRRLSVCDLAGAAALRTIPMYSTSA